LIHSESEIHTPSTGFNTPFSGLLLYYGIQPLNFADKVLSLLCSNDYCEQPPRIRRVKVMKPISVKFLLIGITATLFAANVVFSQEEKLFYRGDFDSQKVEAPNGAIVNADYRKFILEGSSGKTRMNRVREGVHTISGYSLSNYTFIEGKTGLIAVDAGTSIGMGREALAMIREISDKPIVAIIYSHHHYTGGAQAYVEAGGGNDMKVFGHPDLEGNLRSTVGALGPMQIRRASIQLGLYLPHEGPDAAFGPAEPSFEEPALSASGHVPVNHPVADGEEVTIDGLKTVFYHSVADTRDSLIVHFPELDLVVHNTAVTPTAFSLYTLRGDFYRAPADMISSIDRLRQINARYTVGCHGLPLTTREEGYEVATAHRDAYAFIYNQSVRAINRGMTPDEMAESIRLPKHLADHPWLFPGYVDHEYNVRAQYRGIVGWYAEDTADLHPPSEAEMGTVLIEGFGGKTRLIDSARRAYSDKKYNLTARLLSYVLAVEPDNRAARQLKADALRAMAQTTRSGIQTRNFMLTQALHLEGALDWTRPPAVSIFGTPSVEGVLTTPPGTFVKLLESQIDPDKSAEVMKSINITFSDLNQSWRVQVRRGVAEVSAGDAGKFDATLELPRSVWARIVLKEITVEQALANGEARVTGDPQALGAVFGSLG
jgi:linear primary-alkylsulfatase